MEETIRSQNLHEPRYVFMSGNCKHIKLVGGNSLGIFVAENKANQETNSQEHKSAGLKEGDRILEYNKYALFVILVLPLYISKKSSHLTVAIIFIVR